MGGRGVSMIDQDHVLTLLPQIYDCALSPELWRPFLAKISHALGGATSSFHVQDASGHISFHSVSPVDQYIEDRFRNNDERYTSPTLKPMARLLAAPAGALLIRRVGRERPGIPQKCPVQRYLPAARTMALDVRPASEGSGGRRHHGVCTPTEPSLRGS